MSYDNIKGFNDYSIDESGSPVFNKCEIGPYVRYRAVVDMWSGKRHMSNWSEENDNDSAFAALERLQKKYKSDPRGIKCAVVVSNCGEVFPVES